MPVSVGVKYFELEDLVSMRRIARLLGPAAPVVVEDRHVTVAGVPRGEERDEIDLAKERHPYARRTSDAKPASPATTEQAIETFNQN